MQLGVGIVGAGLIGKKRAAAVAEIFGKVVAIADTELGKAEALAKPYGAFACGDWRDLIGRSGVEVVIVAIPNDRLAACACDAMKAGKHVLIEKPGARNVTELQRVKEIATQTGRVARLGFNHRFHPAIWQLRTMIDHGEIGDILGFRARYGHGGRIGYEKEWRARPEVSGGGELIDQGIHLLDLCRWMGGEFDLEFGRIATLFWDMPVEDNAFVFLRGRVGRRYAWLHTSCTEWKNLFSFEVFGATGKLEVLGLGGNYGNEEIQITRVDREKGVPKIEIESFAGPDHSWLQELKAFRGEVAGRRSDIATIDDGIRVLQIVEQVYRASPSQTTFTKCRA